MWLALMQLSRVASTSGTSCPAGAITNDPMLTVPTNAMKTATEVAYANAVKRAHTATVQSNAIGASTAVNAVQHTPSV